MCDQHLLHQLRCQPAITWLSNSLCVCEMKSRAPCIIVPSKTDEKNKTNEKIHLMSSGRQQFSNKSKFLCVTRMLRTTNESVVRYCLRHIQTVGIFPVQMRTGMFIGDLSMERTHYLLWSTQKQKKLKNAHRSII